MDWHIAGFWFWPLEGMGIGKGVLYVNIDIDAVEYVDLVVKVVGVEEHV